MDQSSISHNMSNKYSSKQLLSFQPQSIRESSNTVLPSENYGFLPDRQANNNCSRDCDVEEESETLSDCSQQTVPDYCQVVKFTDEKGNTKELLFPKNLDLDRPKRARTSFNNRQMNALENAFATNQYLVGKERKILSKQLNLSEAQIKVWYQNRRTKYKREQSKEKEQMEASKESVAANNIMKMLQSHQPKLTNNQLPQPIPLSPLPLPSSSSPISPPSSSSTSISPTSSDMSSPLSLSGFHFQPLSHAYPSHHFHHHITNPFTPSAINSPRMFHSNLLQPPNRYFPSILQ